MTEQPDNLAKEQIWKWTAGPGLPWALAIKAEIKGQREEKRPVIVILVMARSLQAYNTGLIHNLR